MTVENGDKTDQDLIAAAAAGSKGAFTELVRRYEDLVYKFSFKVCRDKAEAEEALQDTFINVYKNLHSFDGRSKLSTWLYRIVTNNCLMKRRKRKVDALLEPYDVFHTGDDGPPRGHFATWHETPADVLEKKELHAQLNKAILKLPVDYRIVFVLRDIEGKSNAETAEIVGISEEATKSRLRRARAFLRDQLHAYMSHTEVAA